MHQDEVILWEGCKASYAGSLCAHLLKKTARGRGIWNLISRWYFSRIFSCYVFQMGFIQLNEDFIFIEPFNDTMAILGHPHRLYRQKRSTEGKVREKSALHNHPCGVISGNPSWKDLSQRVLGQQFFEAFCLYFSTSPSPSVHSSSVPSISWFIRY